MSDPTQANRRIAITTPLGPDVLLVRRCSVQEQISRLFQIDLDLNSTRNDIDFNQIVGKNVTIRLDLPGQKKRFFNGFVNRFVQTKSERSFSSYRASVVPWLWFLTRSADCKIFQKSMAEPPDEMTVPGIIKKVFKDHGFEDFKDDGLVNDYRKWEFCVQYRETAFNFVSRLMEQEGISYFFKHEDGRHDLVLADSEDDCPAFENYETIPYHPHTQGGTDEEAVTDWVVQKEVHPTTYILNDFNFEKPKLAPQKGLVVNSTISREHENANFEIYDYPGEFLDHDEGEAQAKLRIEELQAQFEVLSGQASARGIAAGHKFTLKSHPRSDQNRDYLITRASLQIEVGEFEAGAGAGNEKFFSCSFGAMLAAEPFRPPRITPKPLIQGVQTAIVVGPSGDEIHTDEHARVKVQFHWDRYGNHDENSSCWIRVSQSNAGKGWGSMITPRIGQEVIVEFLEGDPDRPIITGRVYNGDQPPPYASGDGVVSGLKSNTHKGSGYNEMSMDDTAGKEKVTIHGQYDMNTTVEHDQTTTVHNNRTDQIDVDDSETVGNNQTGTVGNDQTETIGGNQTLSVAKDRSRNVGQNETVTVALMRTHTVGVNEAITVGAAQEITVGVDQAVTIGVNQQNTVGKNQTNTIGQERTTSVGKNDALTVKKKLTIEAGDEILIKTGKASIHMKKDGTIEISGKDIKVEGSGEINVKATKNITMKGQKILQN
jgi:type VI secretion system secreted protein VgrG